MLEPVWHTAYTKALEAGGRPGFMMDDMIDWLVSPHGAEPFLAEFKGKAPLLMSRDNSRLSCQITMSDALDGLVVELPDSQH